MTRVWVALGLLAIILALAFTEFNFTVNTSDDILEILEKTEISARSQSDETVKLCGEMEEIWNNRRNYLSMFLSHDEIDEIDISIESLIRLSEQKNYDKFYIECGVLLNHIQSIKDSEKILPRNLL